VTHSVMQMVYALAPGGSELLAGEVARAGIAAGMTMSVCALHRGGSLQQKLEKAGVRTHVIGRRDGFHPDTFLRAYRLFKRHRPTVVITHHLGQLFYSALGARLAGCRLLHVEHECYTIASTSAQRRLRFMTRLANRVVGVSEEVVSFLVNRVGLPSNKVELIPNGVDVGRFRPRPRALQVTLAKDGDEPIIGTVGRLDPVKDHATLVAAFGRVLTVWPNAMLVIVGDGEMRSALEVDIESRGMERHVKLLGERGDLDELIPAMDVFVLSSVCEGLPLALLEAMACGRPVVVTDAGAAAGLVNKAGAGRSVPCRDPEALARAILQVLESQSDASQMGRAGRAFVEKHHNLDETVAAYLSLVRKVGGPGHFCSGASRINR